MSEYFGFTQTEVDRILDDARMRDKAEQVKVWYDGYHFGDFDVYCPWDVMSYLRDVQRDPAAMPVGYWKNTSDNAIIYSFIDMKSDTITRKIFIMLFWRESLPEPDIWWSRIGNMVKSGVTWW